MRTSLRLCIRPPSIPGFTSRSPTETRFVYFEGRGQIERIFLKTIHTHPAYEKGHGIYIYILYIYIYIYIYIYSIYIYKYIYIHIYMNSCVEPVVHGKGGVTKCPEMPRNDVINKPCVVTGRSAHKVVVTVHSPLKGVYIYIHISVCVCVCVF